MRKLPIILDTAKALTWLGTLYRSPADAIKEHVSNAIDEHFKAKEIGKALPVCTVTFTLEKDNIVIEYPYGMSKEEFREALQRVADSAKKSLDIKQIGRLGIGIFSYNQIGKKCTFFSKKDKGDETIKVVLREGSDKYGIDTARKRESLSNPGIKIIISSLLVDPIKPRGPLSRAKLQRVFAEKFNSYLEGGSLKITIKSKEASYTVEPLKIELPRVGKSYVEWPIKGNRSKKLSLKLYFDPSGKGSVSIRHIGVPIVGDIKTSSAYGIEESFYANGDVKGFIDADFLIPLPAREGFVDNDDWKNLIVELNRLQIPIEAEVEKLKQEEAEKRLTEIQKKAIKLARDILNTDEFKDLELLEGMGRKHPEPRIPPSGFDFVPSSKRIEPGKMGTLPLKVFVPRVVPDNSLVKLSISDSSSVELKTENIILKASEADGSGIVSTHVFFVGKLITPTPAILTATTGNLKAEAYISVAKPGPKREPITGEEKEGRGINFEEVAFDEGPSKHSQYVSRIIQINTLNPDFKQAKKGSEGGLIAYDALMIGKENIAYDAKIEAADECLERIISFHFRIKNRVTSSPTGGVKRISKRPRKSI